MRKPKFVSVDWNLKKIAAYLQMSLVIASSTQFSQEYLNTGRDTVRQNGMRVTQFSASQPVTQQLLLNTLVQRYMLPSI